MKKFATLFGITLITLFGSATWASESFSAKDRVLALGNTGEYTEGTVLEVFGGKLARVNWDLTVNGKNIGTVTTVSTDILQKRVGCSQNICDEDRVLASGNTGEYFEGTVLEVFSGGIAGVNWDLVVDGKNIGTETFVPVNTLSKKSE